MVRVVGLHLWVVDVKVFIYMYIRFRCVSGSRGPTEYHDPPPPGSRGPGEERIKKYNTISTT